MKKEKKIIPDVSFCISLASIITREKICGEEDKKKIMTICKLLREGDGITTRLDIEEAIYKKMYGKIEWASIVKKNSRNKLVGRTIRYMRKALVKMDCDLYVEAKKLGGKAKICIVPRKEYCPPAPCAWIQISNPDPVLAKEFDEERNEDLSLIEGY